MDLLDGTDRARLQSVAPILPVREMRRSIAFYEQLGFLSEAYDDGSEYVFLSRDGQDLHLTQTNVREWTFNPCGVYFYVDDADVFYDEVLAAGVAPLHPPEDKPWRMREFAVSDPDRTLLRFGERIHLR